MKTVVLTCFICNKNFERRFKQFKYESKNKENYHVLCSNECRKKFRSTKKIVNCSLCLKEIIKKPSSIRENNFCNNVCSAIYSNKNRCVDKKRTKTIKCVECNIDATIQINKKKYMQIM